MLTTLRAAKTAAHGAGPAGADAERPFFILCSVQLYGGFPNLALMTVDALSFPEALADVHARFEQIHPFLDGNGRAGRLVLNLLLVRMGYPPAIIYKRERPRYLRSLRRADQGDHGSLGELLARAILDNLYRFIVPAVAGPARLVPLPALATRKVSAAAARGRLEATKGADGTWRSSRLWVNQYLSGRARKRKPTTPEQGGPDASRVHDDQIELLPPRT